MLRKFVRNKKTFFTPVFAAIFIIFISVVYINYKKTELIPPPTVIDIGNIENISTLTIEDIYKLNDGNVDITYEPGTERPREIKGKFTANKILNQQDAAVALMGLRKLLLISEYDFYCYEEVEGAKVNTYQLGQIHDGIPVNNFGFQVTVSKSGDPIAVIGRFMDVGDVIQTDPVISYKEGLNVIELEDGSCVKSAQLVFFGMDAEKPPSLCWKYETGRKNPDLIWVYDTKLIEDKTVFIDAVTGDIIVELSNNFF